MKFEFDSLQELKDFIKFVNADKEQILKEVLDQAANDLKKAVIKEQGEKNV